MQKLVHSPDCQLMPPGRGSRVDFVGEGMANVVFSFPDATGPMQGMLIRTPKGATGPYADIHRHWCENIYPLFSPRDLVPQYLVHVSQADGVLDPLKHALATQNQRRKPKFRDSKLKEKIDQCMLINDMRPRSPDEHLVEFKPKWLAQSPTAPKDAKRCRNCAREALRNNKAHTADPIFCPLRLLDRDDPESRRQVWEKIVDSKDFPEGSVQARNLDLWLRENDLLPRLRDAQLGHDNAGVLEHKDKFSLGLAMTLRDCSCYVRISGARLASSASEIEARLGDLDLKDPNVKLEYWKKMELNLLDGGYYSGREMPPQRTQCKLEGSP